MNLLKHGTTNTIHIGPFVDDTDGATLETGFTLLAAEIFLAKENGSYAASSATGISHDANGEYTVTLSAADCNTVGRLTITVKKAGALVVPQSFYIPSIDVFNSWTLNSGAMKMDMNTIGGFGLTSGDWELEGKRLHLVNTDNNGVAFKAEATGTTSSGIQASGTSFDIESSELISIKADTGQVVALLPVSGLIASQESVDAIENTTRIQVSMTTHALIPSIGVNLIRIKVFLKDTIGNPEDPDNDEISVQARTNNSATFKTNFFDDEPGSTPSTASVTFTPSYLKMVKLAVGSYEIFYGIETTDLADGWSFIFSYEETAVQNDFGRALIVESELSGGTVLADVVTNHIIIAKSMKNNNVSGEASLTGSVHNDLITPQNQIVSKLPSGIISDYNLGTLIGSGSRTVQDVLKYQKAMFNGRIRKNFPATGDFTLYDDDNVTILSVVHSDSLERTRLS